MDRDVINKQTQDGVIQNVRDALYIDFAKYRISGISGYFRRLEQLFLKKITFLMS